MEINKTATQDFSFLLREIGQEIKINDQSETAIITKNTYTNDYDDRILSTLIPVQRGDMIEYNNANWVVYSDIAGEQRFKYKAQIRHLPHTLSIQVDTKTEVVGEDSLGRPITEETPIFTDVDCYAQQNSVMTTEGQIRLVNGDIIFTTADNEQAKDISVNDTFEFNGTVYQIYAVDRTDLGLIHINAEVN
ncbi:hypothetical protein [Salibacterium lacus]|uniref:Phage protein n=1 Tax=Salibacterium lacus TaxID=1898109 RepID=A0ABW5SWV8_9BACI